ncbi:hypothetical protein [Hyalangium minutum]|uniref:hypothetical protein n=1 Tax=Hyalangium minutum TaxID=394096 RepID=UPI0012F9B49E|nr:hypothetical protein [Hyalangium minutum]
MNLQVLFPRAVWPFADTFTRMLQKVHPSLAHVRVEMRIPIEGPSVGLMEQLALVQWAQHTVYVGFLSVPAPADLLEQTVNTALLYEDAWKEQAHAHTAHAILIYKGQERSPLEQYRALAKIAVGLLPLGASVVLNPNACTSCPVVRLAPQPGEELEQVLSTLPWMTLFIGFVTLQVEGHEGLWVRTCGAPRLNMPDLALHIDRDQDVRNIYRLFRSTFDTMHSTGVRFKAGDMLVDEELQWKFRQPRADEGFLYSPQLIVFEPMPPTGPMH